MERLLGYKRDYVEELVMWRSLLRALHRHSSTLLGTAFGPPLWLFFHTFEATVLAVGALVHCWGFF